MVINRNSFQIVSPTPPPRPHTGIIQMKGCLFPRVASNSSQAKLAAPGLLLPAPVSESHWKLWWSWIKIPHENTLKSPSSLAECQQQGNSQHSESDATPQRIQSVSLCLSRGDAVPKTWQLSIYAPLSKGQTGQTPLLFPCKLVILSKTDFRLVCSGCL